MQFSKKQYQLASDDYMLLRRQKVKRDLGLPLDEGFESVDLDQAYMIAEETFNMQIKMKLKLEDKVLPKKDFSNYTLEDYHKLTEFEDKYHCMNALFAKMHNAFG